jgi:hypothetical protein
VPSPFRSFLYGCAAAQNDQVSKRDLLLAGLRAIKILLNPLQRLQGLGQFGRLSAPFAPPRLSEPRKLAADLQAVLTSWEIDSPDPRILVFREAISRSPINS